MDFDDFSDIQLTFNSNLSSHLVSINITTDGLFEDETESFSVSLSTRRVVELQLRTSSINLRQIVCDDMESLNVFTVSNNSAVMNEEINIDLDRVILTQTREGITFSFVDNEISRLSMNPSVATVTILDNDSKCGSAYMSVVSSIANRLQGFIQDGRETFTHPLHP